LDVTAETNDALQAGITDRKQAEVAQRENEEQPRLAPDNLARRDRSVLLGTVLLSLAIFLAHCLAPVRHSVWPILVWPFYLIPLMLTGLTRERRYPPILAALCTVLVVLGSFFTSPGLYPLATIFRHAIGVSILWITAVLLVRRIREGEASREQQDLLSESQRVAHIGSWRHYVTGRITWSDEMYRTYGRSPDTFTPNADSFRNLIHPEDRAAMQAWIAACVAGEKPRELEFRAILPDGRVRNIKSRGDLRCDRNGRPLYIAGTARDITEQKQAEEALQAVEDRLRRGRMGTFDWDIAHDRITWSRGLEVLFGGSGEVGSTYETFAQRVHPQDLPGVDAEISRSMAARDSFAHEYRIVWPDGSVHWMAGRGEFTFSDAGQAVGMRGVVLDITERKQAEAALRETESRYRDLVENSHDLLCTHDLEGQVLSCNPAPARILGYTVEEILQRSMRDLLAPERRDRFDEYLARVQKDGIAEGLMLVITRARERRVWEYRNTLRTEGVPAPIVRGMAHDITERLRAEKALRESEEKYRGLFERMSSGVAVYRATGDGEDFVFVDFNHAAEEIEHIGRQSVIGKRVTEVFPGVKEFGIFSVFQRVLRTGEPEYVAPALYRDERDPGTWRESWVYRLTGSEIVAVYNDITERKRAEGVQNWLASFPKLDPSPVVEADVTGRVLYLNPAAERLFPDMESRGVAHPWLAGLEDVERTCRTSASSECLREVLVDGAWYYQVTHLVPSTQKLRLYGFDITDHKRAEAALRESEARLRLSIQSANIGLWDWNLVTNEVYFSREWKIQIGCAEDEIPNRFEEWQSRVHPDDLEPTLQKVRASIASPQGRHEVEFRFRHKDGSYRWIRAQADVLRDAAGKPVRMLGCHLDITDRKHAEDAQRRQALTFENMYDAVTVIDEDYNITDWNPAATRMFGYEKTEVLGQSVSCLHSPEAAKRQLGSIRTGLESAGRFDGELAAVRKDGTRFMVRSVIVPLRDEHGTQIGIIGVSRDISERKRAEYALRASEEKYREMVDNASFGIFRSTLDGQLLDVNPALVAMLGYGSKEELMMHSLKADIYEDPSDRTSILARYETSERVNNVETKWKRKDGNLITVRMSGRGVRGEDGQISHFEVIVEDVTGLRVLEDELRRAQKMEAVGRLAGGVAHDFNNILTAIQMNGSLLAGGLVPPDRLQEKARNILASADRGAALTRQLLAFGRKQVLAPRILDLNEMLRGLSFLIRGIIPENISVTASLSDSLGMVKADPHQLENAILNLIINARNAMPNGGRLIIETSNVDASEHSEPITRILPPGQYVMVALTDTGIGMDPATQARIFEPFFTTRRNEGGTGLGLATSYGTVKQSGGYIFVYSARDQGTTFKIFLPIVDAEPTAVAAAAEPISNRGRGQTILLVEDEDMVRNSAAEFLSAYGYVVLEARNGPEALKLAMSRPSDIAAVVTDMVMPGIDGREVVEILRQLRPQLKAVLMSGYTERLEVVEDEEAASFTFLQKPFTVEVLANTLRKVISGS
jgi:PAS domain S-box-containing protein